MKLKNGKLYDNGVEVKLEFGNIDHIKFLERVKKLDNAYQKGKEIEVETEVSYYHTAIIPCICGKYLHQEIESDQDDDFDEFDEIKAKCRGCGKDYVLSVNAGQVIARYA